MLNKINRPMKKFISLFAVTLLLFVTASCTSCNNEVKKMETMVESTIQSDSNYMAANYSPDFIFYESDILLNEYLDDENCTGTVYSVTNVFEFVTTVDSTSYQPTVVLITHTADMFQVKEVQGTWIEDFAINADDVALTYRQAYKQLMKANYPKPHSRNCILRKPIGPYECNAQYVFGDISTPYFVDAVTGNVTNSNPAFNRRE